MAPQAADDLDRTVNRSVEVKGRVETQLAAGEEIVGTTLADIAKVKTELEGVLAAPSSDCRRSSRSRFCGIDRPRSARSRS